MNTDLRRSLRRQRTRANRLLGLPPQRTVVTRRGQTPAEPLDEFTLWASIATFAEEDVIEATVANAFAQGCERVFLLDNASPDATVARALAAGAEVVDSWESDAFDEFERSRRANRWMAQLSPDAPTTSVWWLHLDADEFPHGPGTRTVREHLELLDRSYRVVGAEFWNHFPTPGRTPAYERGRHPLDDQPLVEREPFRYCWHGHYKHPLVRVDRGAPTPQLLPGAHLPMRYGGHRMVEPPAGIVVHHMQFRDEETTRARMALTETRLVRDEPIANRMRFVDAVYQGRWDAAPIVRGRFGNRAPRPKLWTGGRVASHTSTTP